MGLNLGVISMLIEFILVTKYSLKVAMEVYLQRKGELLEFKLLCSKMLTISISISELR